MDPDLARPGLDVVPVDQIVERLQIAGLDVFGPVGLDIEHIRSLARRQRGLERGEQRVLLVPGDLDLDAGMRLFEVLRRQLAIGDLGVLVGLVAPDVERHVLGARA